MKLLVNTDVLVKEKACILLVHLCVDVITQRQAASGPENKTAVDDQLLGVAVVKISEACLLFSTVSRLAASQIIPILEKPINYEKFASAESDLWVSAMRSVGIFSC
jgi:hypothetical protein